MKYYSDTVTNDFYSQFAGKHNIGGIIGGHKKHINHLITEFNTLGKLCLDNEIIRQDTLIKTILGVPQLIDSNKIAKANRDDQRKD